jgi:hypothetical protein
LYNLKKEHVAKSYSIIGNHQYIVNFIGNKNKIDFISVINPHNLPEKIKQTQNYKHFEGILKLNTRYPGEF